MHQPIVVAVLDLYSMVAQITATVAMNFGSFGGRIAAGTNQYYPMACRLQYFDDSASTIVARQSRPSHQHSIARGRRPRDYDAVLAAHWLVGFGYLFPVCLKFLIAFLTANLVIDLVAGLALAGFD